ncbi:PREDICTED: E3 ubiquitin-protein ligase TRIM37 [Nicrophorus vespilloides]|uniref:E3 ubiquitin-protein ligase TRIM37 n=1 Tax=Nicrophorus vespilloides TaxID=110193 RepID=A0ABM1N7A7_NICVS|nr:PREDICTED: E3 ubiquitin-protein ligase TRIM37 [Nicrophorus vespilloides]
MESGGAEIEELMLCGYCKLRYNDNDQSPKMLSCKHYFCLQCMRTWLNKGQELLCVHCWKRTDLGEKGPESLPTYTPVLCLAKNFSEMRLKLEKPPAPIACGSKLISENCHTHAMPLALWCQTCGIPVCRACAATSDHTSHQVKSQNETKDQLVNDLHTELQSMNKMLNEISRLAMQQREFLVKILEACVTLKTHVEADLTNHSAHLEVNEIRELLAKIRMNVGMVDNLADVQGLYSSLNVEKQRMQMRYQDMFHQCQLDDLIRNSPVLFDFQLLKQALASIQNGDIPYSGNSRMATNQQNPILFLANYCMSQLYSRHVITKQINGNIDYLHSIQPTQNYLPVVPAKYEPIIMHSPQLSRNPITACPLYYFNIEVNGAPAGRVIIEVRSDVAPKMSKNFGLLATGESGIGYKGCNIFQCWEGESVITGDYELNNGRGGRSIFEESFFLPDDTKLLAVRGTVGMRRTQKRHDNLGMVGSQFRIILQEMRGFTGIFGHVIEGLELIEKLSTYGDTNGKPTKTILIAKCGKL